MSGFLVQDRHSDRGKGRKGKVRVTMEVKVEVKGKVKVKVIARVESGRGEGPWGKSSLPCPQADPPHDIAQGNQADKGHDPVPEAQRRRVPVNLEVGVVKNVLQKVKGLGFVGEVHARVVQGLQERAPGLQSPIEPGVHDVDVQQGCAVVWKDDLETSNLNWKTPRKKRSASTAAIPDRSR
jgi:hypothetical protein